MPNPNERREMAAAALAGLLANDRIGEYLLKPDTADPPTHDEKQDRIAALAVALADKTLAAL